MAFDPAALPTSLPWFCRLALHRFLQKVTSSVQPLVKEFWHREAAGRRVEEFIHTCQKEVQELL